MTQSNILPSGGATLSTPGRVLEEASLREKARLQQRRSQFIRASFCAKRRPGSDFHPARERRVP